MLNQSILLELSVFGLCLLWGFRVIGIHFRFVVDHVVQGKLSKIEFFTLNELFLEGFYIFNKFDSFSLVQISRFVDPYALSSIIHKVDLIWHDIKSVCFGQKRWNWRFHYFILLFEFNLQFIECLQEIKFMGNDLNVRNMIYYLFSFFKRVEIYLSGWLNPFEEEMRRKLFFLAHQIKLFPFFEEIAD